MENNIFYQNRKEIAAIANQRHVTVDIATQIYMQKHSLTGCAKELGEWTKLCQTYMRDKDKTLQDLFR